MKKRIDSSVTVYKQCTGISCIRIRKLTELPSYFYRPCILTPFLSRRNFSYYLHEFIPPSWIRVPRLYSIYSAFRSDSIRHWKGRRNIRISMKEYSFSNMFKKNLKKLKERHRKKIIRKEEMRWKGKKKEWRLQSLLFKSF